MGYQSSFRIKVEQGEVPELGAWISERTEYGEVDTEGVHYAYGKWYDAQSDLTQLSSDLGASVVLICERYGEEAPDMEVWYFRGGQCEGGKPQIVWPENPWVTR